VHRNEHAAVYARVCTAANIKKQVYADEEDFTVGLNQYMLPDPTAVPATITENMIRLEHGVPIRHKY
jgi:hypothetical protein